MGTRVITYRLFSVRVKFSNGLKVLFPWLSDSASSLSQEMFYAHCGLHRALEVGKGSKTQLCQWVEDPWGFGGELSLDGSV